MTMLDALRSHAVRRSLSFHPSIDGAVSALGFVQADPIRAPARAQDLILRQRVQGYRSGDLERLYPQLPLSEDVLHVYGYLPSEVLHLLHPRPLSAHWQAFVQERRTLRLAVLRLVEQFGIVHPRAVEKELGRKTCENGWGGQSSETTMMMEALHLQGELRVARREAGQRVYERAVVPKRSRPLSEVARAEGLCLLLTSLYAPLPLRSLRPILGAVRGPKTQTPKEALQRLLASGELRCERIESEDWIWPEAETAQLRHANGGEDRVRLLAPFDPVVWDRRRFARLWGWEYRFEAYTPVAKRKLGYYALPLLYRDQVLGAANVAVNEGQLSVDLRFIHARPKEAAFRQALEAELAALRDFLQEQSPIECGQGLTLKFGKEMTAGQGLTLKFG
jgi:uncharacterized protein YcaQ